MVEDRRQSATLHKHTRRVENRWSGTEEAWSRNCPDTGKVQKLCTFKVRRTPQPHPFLPCFHQDWCLDVSVQRGDPSYVQLSSSVQASFRNQPKILTWSYSFGKHTQLPSFSSNCLGKYVYTNNFFAAFANCLGPQAISFCLVSIPCVHRREAFFTK